MPENIDNEFYEAMRSIGGLRPAEIDPEAGKTLNADVIFPVENVVIEIKTLMADPSERTEYVEKVSAIYNRWVGHPGAPFIYGLRTINSADVSPEMAFELIRTLGDPIRTAVTKANRQIREVKASLNMPYAHGVLLLCNSGAKTMTPHVILHAMHHALGNRHRSINSAIFLTHGVPAYVPDVPEPVNFFLSVSRPNFEPLPEAFAGKIRNAWMQYQSRKQPVRVYYGVDGSKLLDAANELKCQN